MKSQVTTKQGDKGFSSGLDGVVYSKAHPVMACTGAVDELRTQTALLRLRIIEERPADPDGLGDVLLWLMHAYFLIGSACSDPGFRKPRYHVRILSAAHLARLEAEQARLEAVTPLPHAFVASASNTLSAQADITCTFARRLERELTRLKETVPEMDTRILQPFVNRISDFLYIVARRLDGGKYVAVDYAILDGAEGAWGDANPSKG